MDLDRFEDFSEIDRQDMFGQINSLPNQLVEAWQLGQSLELPAFDHIQRVLIAGMGGSAIGADILSAYIASLCEIPVVVHRDYGLPAWAIGPETLVIASSHSGNTEETLSAYNQAMENHCNILAISTGGKLAQDAMKDGIPLWTFQHKGQPRAAVGYSFGLLLSLFTRLGLIPDPYTELLDAVEQMRQQQQMLKAELPIAQNPAKRLAGQLVGRWVTVIGADILAPVARRWKGQISEIAKAWAQFEILPEVDHNTLAGVDNPESALMNTFVLFLRSSSEHPRNKLRIDLTRKIFMLQGLGTDLVDARGEMPLANQWTCLHLGDYVAYYLAMIYEVDPTPVETIEAFKQDLGQ